MHQQKIWAMHFNLQARKFDSRSSLGHAVHSLLFLHLASSYWNLFRKFERQLMTAKYFYEKELVLMTVESWVAYSDNMYVVFWAGSMSGLVTRLMFDDGGGWCHLYTRPFRHGCHIKEWWRRDRCRWQCWNIDVIIVNRDHSDGRIPNNTRNWEHVWLQLRWGYCQEDASQMQQTTLMTQLKNLTFCSHFAYSCLLWASNLHCDYNLRINCLWNNQE